jgi:hypothetical protein
MLVIPAEAHMGHPIIIHALFLVHSTFQQHPYPAHLQHLLTTLSPAYLFPTAAVPHPPLDAALLVVPLCVSGCC